MINYLIAAAYVSTFLGFALFLGSLATTPTSLVLAVSGYLLTCIMVDAFALDLFGAVIVRDGGSLALAALGMQITLGPVMLMRVALPAVGHG